MKKLIANYHTHTELCGHAIGMAEDYVKQAIEAGFQELGISDHGPIPKYWMPMKDYNSLGLSRQMNYDDFKNIYLPDINQAIENYGHQIKIYKGVEIEYLEGHDDYYKELLKDLDYLNLGIHFFEVMGHYVNTYFDLDEELIVQYGKTAKKALDTKLFKIFVHPDLYMYNFNHTKKPFFFNETCEKVAIEIIEAAIKNDVYLEVNAGGVGKGKRKGLNEYPYPRTEFWKLVKSYPEAKIIIGCDAHLPYSLNDSAVDETIKFVNDLGLNVQSKVIF